MSQSDDGCSNGVTIVTVRVTIVTIRIKRMLSQGDKGFRKSYSNGVTDRKGDYCQNKGEP